MGGKEREREEKGERRRSGDLECQGCCASLGAPLPPLPPLPQEQFNRDEREVTQEELDEAKRKLTVSVWGAVCPSPSPHLTCQLFSFLMCLQAERARSSSLQQQVETLQTKLTDMEMASNVSLLAVWW